VTRHQIGNYSSGREVLVMLLPRGWLKFSYLNDQIQGYVSVSTHQSTFVDEEMFGGRQLNFLIEVQDAKTDGPTLNFRPLLLVYSQ
jgi:hypothetical protein